MILAHNAPETHYSLGLQIMIIGLNEIFHQKFTEFFYLQGPVETGIISIIRENC